MPQDQEPTGVIRHAARTLGFFCNWDPIPEITWSHTPWQLREALRRQASVVDLGIRLPGWQRHIYRAAYARRRRGRWVTEWKRSEVFDKQLAFMLDQALRRSKCDVVLQIQDLAAPSVPFLVYQDLSFDLLLAHQAEHGDIPHFPGLTSGMLARLHERQRGVYERAAGVVAMSHWFGATLTRLSGVPPERVFVVQPGRTAAGPTDLHAPTAREGPRKRLLLVGKDFHTKGGDVVLGALAILRRQHDADITLTVVGPRNWPVAGEVPPGVTFLGRLPSNEIARLYASHDLLVMPSRLEGFGIAFVEALAHGLPCIGRNAFAMPEIILGNNGGLLVEDDDPAALADAIVKALADDELYERCARNAPAVAAHFTWDRAARDMIAAVDRVAR